jgi:hypothetical protein
MFTDHAAAADTAIHRHGPAAVLPQRLEVMWPDGSSLQLHPVLLHGCAAPLHRALLVDGTWALLSLQRALPHVADDIRVSAPRDHHGLIWWALTRSGRWANAPAFVTWARQHLQPLQGGAAVALPDAEAEQAQA